MKKGLTELVFIVDESGSMSGLEKDTIGGINSTLKKQKKEDGKCLVSTVFFANNQKVVHDRVDLKKVNLLKEESYFPSGCTALIDTIGSSIKHIKNVHKYIREEDVPEKTMFVITTDGMENASHKYSLKEVKKMIEEQKEKGWEFIFLAANIDAYETAKDYGIDEDSTVNYVNDAVGNSIKYESVCEAITQVRTTGTLKKNWSAKAKKDYESRGNKQWI